MCGVCFFFFQGEGRNRNLFQGPEFRRGPFQTVRAVVPVASPVEKPLAQNTGEGIKRFFQTPWLAFAVLLFAFAIEFGQYWGLVDKLGLGGNRLARIVIGSHFDPLDLVAYFVGYLILLGCYWKSRQS